eukprot:SAG11_NODE_1297_length_5269_cov_3.432302_4_plen_93_part_00
MHVRCPDEMKGAHETPQVRGVKRPTVGFLPLTAGRYADRLKNPTGPITPRRFSNGKFLMTFFADSQQGVSVPSHHARSSAGRAKDREECRCA